MIHLTLRLVLAAMITSLICTTWIHRRTITEKIRGRRRMSEVTLGELLTIISGLTGAFGTISFWFHKRLNKVEGDLSDIKMYVTGSEESVHIEGHDERIKNIETKIEMVLENLNNDKLEDQNA